jgi:tight adherence protein B
VIAIVALLVLTALALERAIAAAGANRVRDRVESPVEQRRATVPTTLFDRVLRVRRDRMLERSLPDAIDAMARALRSGGSLRQAVEEAAASSTGLLAAELGVIVADVRDGASLPAALERWSRARPLPSVRLVTAALGLGAETGGASAQAIDGVSSTLRTNLGIAGEVRALSSQARLSALVIVLAPLAFTFLAAMSDPSTGTFLLRTPVGLACLAAGLALDALGWWWMRRIIAVVA